MFDRRAPARLVALAVLATACTGSDATPTPESTAPTVPITAEPLPEITEEPSTPVGLIVVSTDRGTVELAWGDSRDETVTGYEVVRVTPGGRTERFETTDAVFTDRGLEDGAVFTYQVAAVGPGGRSTGSEAVTAKVGVDENPPSAPGRPRTVESASGVELTWTASSDFSGIDSYVLTRTVGGEVVDINVGAATAYVDDVAAGQIASYRVRAVDGAGNESASSRETTVLTGTAADRVVIVVSAVPNPSDTAETRRLQQELLDAGFTLTWFEDDAFDANITSSDDVVLLLGDVQGQGFDWNVFATDSTIIGLKSMFVEAGGITENSPKLDGLAQLDYVEPGEDAREVVITTTPKPKPVVYIPEGELLPSLQTWARPTWSATTAVAGLIPKGEALADEKPAPGCRAFFPGNTISLSEMTNEAWGLLVEFVGDISVACQ